MGYSISNVIQMKRSLACLAFVSCFNVVHFDRYAGFGIEGAEIISMQTRNKWLGCCGFVLIVSVFGVPSYGQQAYFSVEGQITTNLGQHDIFFDLTRSVGSAEDLRFLTFAQDAGPNAAGDAITVSTIDTVLELFSANAGVNVSNDDGGTLLDSLLTWPGITTGGTLAPDPLPLANDYRLKMRDFNNDSTGTWGVDLVGPADALRLTQLLANSANPGGGVSQVDSIKFGTTGAGSTAATFDYTGLSTLNVTGELVVGNTGLGVMNVPQGAITVGGKTTVTSGGVANINGGTYNATGGLDVNGAGLLQIPGRAEVNLSSGTLNTGATSIVTSGANINQTGGLFNANALLTIDTGGDFILSNGTLNANATLDLQPAQTSPFPVPAGTLTLSGGTLDSTGLLTVQGGGVLGLVGGTIQASGGFVLDATDLIRTSGNFLAGPGGNVTIQNGALFEWGGPFGSLTLSDGNIVRVTGNGSLLRQTTDGTLGAGILFIENNTFLRAASGGDIELEFLVFRDGDIQIDGAGSTLTAANVTQPGFHYAIGIGAAVNASLLVSAGGSVDLTGDGVPIVLLGQSGATGSISVVTGSSMTVNALELVTGGTNDVDVRSGSSLTVNGSLSINDGSTTVNGTSSVLTVTGGTTVGNGGFGGSLSVGTDASANLQNLSVGATFTPGTTGSVLVNGGADLTVGSLNIGNAGAGATTGSVTVTDAGSTIVQNGASTLTVGSSQSSTGTLDIGSFNAIFTTGTGAANINATGTVSMTGGSFNANGPMTIKGLFTKTAGTLNVNQDITVDGGTLQNIGGGVAITSGKTVKAINNGAVGFSGFYSLNNNASIVMESGSDLTVGGFLDIGDTTNGTVVIDGLGSSLNTSQVIASNWGSNGGFADVLIWNQAVATLGPLNLAAGTTANTSANLAIESGANVTVGNLNLAVNGPTNTGTATLTVDGPGSKLIQTGSSTLAIGHANAGSANLVVKNGGLLTTGTGTTTVNLTGTLSIGAGGGTINANGDVVVNGGTILTSASSAFNLATGKNVTVSAGGAMILSNDFSISGSSQVIVNSNGGLQVNGLLDIGGSTATLIVDQGQLLQLDPGTNLWGEFSSATVDFSNMTTATLGDIEGTTLNWTVQTGASATIGNLHVVSLPEVGAVSDLGVITVNGVGSAITQTGASTLILGNQDAGSATLNIQNGGTFTTGTGTTTINATGTLTLNGGTLNATTIDHTQGGNFDFVDGTLTVGTFNGDLNQFGGILAPGASPGLTQVNGNYNLIVGTLAIEIGGALPGTDFDRVDVTGAAILSGELAVSLVNGFVPNYGDSFEFLTAGTGLNDAFTLLNFPSLPLPNMAWNLVNTGSSLILSTDSTLVGDLNNDGFVGIGDLNIVLGNWNLNVPPADSRADPSGDNFVGIDDLNAVLGNWNAGTPPPPGLPANTGANVPEPAGLVLMGLGMTAVYSRATRREKNTA